MRLHPSAAVLAALLALPVAAPSALAANITASDVDGVASLVDFSAAADEVNEVTVTRAGNTLTFTQPSAPLTAGSDACEQPGGAGTPVTCTIAPTGATVVVTLLNLDDELDATAVGGVFFNVTGGNGVDTLRGGDGGNQLAGDAAGDTLVGGAGDDDLIGGDGADAIAGGGQAADPASCGDEASYSGATGDLVVSLDDQPNDTTDGDVLTGVESVTGGSGDDALTGNGARNCLRGRAGDDALAGMAGDDDLAGNEGGDALDGGDGDDTLDDVTHGDQRADVVGGAGIDRVSFCAFTPGPVSAARDMTITLDGVANDGPDANDNVHGDVEDLFTCEARDTIFGTAEFNVIRSSDGDDTVDPAGGSDYVDAGDGNDTVEARDGFGDRVDCGEGSDTARVDQLDTVRDCETVVREGRPVSLEDRPPAVTFDAPRAGARVPANTPTTLRATASDDRGVARVLFMDDDRVVCTDTAPPYDCAYQPRAEDVNRNTLAAVAVDTAEQAAFASRSVTVPRFTPTQLTARTTPPRDRRRPFRFTTTGQLTLPAALPVSRTACRGRISIQVKTGGATISTRRTTLTRACTYRSRVTFRVPRRFVRRALRVTVRFAGNAVVAPRNARSYFIRTS